jgi:hypothetical protein
MWTYFCYDDGGPGDLWSRWFRQQSRQTQARQAVVFKFLEAGIWSEPGAKKLDGGSGLWEVRINSSIEYRLFGFHGPDRRSFSIMIVGSHKERVYTPRNVIKTGIARMAEVERSRKGLIVCVRPT